MTLFLPGGAVHGTLRAVPSKSEAHRLFLCAALGPESREIVCEPLAADLAATLSCLSALGASVSVSGARVRIEPIRSVGAGVRILLCGESGTTLRFLLPLVGVLGADAVFERRGRLGLRPLEPLVSELGRHGMTIEEDGALLRCSGQLAGGDWTLAGNVSSQFVSAMLLALPLLEEDSRLAVTGPVESAPYIALTERILRSASIRFACEGAVYAIPGRQRPQLPPLSTVEGDWSAAAPFLAMGALSPEGVAVEGLSLSSCQGDRAILDLLCASGAEVRAEEARVFVRKRELRGLRFDAAQMPDLAPVIAALGALAEGETRIEHAARLRDKESDRLRTTAAMLAALGADIEELLDGLVIRGKPSLPGGETECFADHRVAMAAALASCGCAGGVRLRGAGCVDKSNPRFWDDFGSLGGL